MNLSSHLQRRTRQSIYIIIIDTNSFRCRAGFGGNYYYVGNYRGEAWPAEDGYDLEEMAKDMSGSERASAAKKVLAAVMDSA